MAVHMTLTDIEEYSLRLNNVLDCTIYNQITVGNVTLPKAVLSTVKIFAVYVFASFYLIFLLVLLGVQILLKNGNFPAAFSGNETSFSQTSLKTCACSIEDECRRVLQQGQKNSFIDFLSKKTCNLCLKTLSEFSPYVYRILTSVLCPYGQIFFPLKIFSVLKIFFQSQKGKASF